jgi:hypothetical protein
MHGEHVGNFLNPYEFSCEEYEAAKEASYDVYPDCKFSTRLLLKADNVAATTKFAGTPYASATVHNATRPAFNCNHVENRLRCASTCVAYYLSSQTCINQTANTSIGEPFQAFLLETAR